jgi:hypothetical protein
MSVNWNPWEVLISTSQLASESIIYTGDVSTSGSTAIEVFIETTIDRPGSLALTIFGANLSTLSESVQSVNGPRFFSASGSIGFVLKSDELSTFNLKIQSKFAVPIGLVLKIRRAVDDSSAAASNLAALQAIELSTSAIQTQTDGLELTSESVNLNAEAISLSVDGVEGFLEALLQATTQPLMLSGYWIGLTGNQFQLSDVPLVVRSVILKAVGAAGQNTNLGDVEYGTAAGSSPWLLRPGESTTIEAPMGSTFDLSSIYVSGAPSDGLAVMYMAAP